MSKEREMIMRCLAHYINYLLEKQRENKKRGYPSIIDEDIGKKIEGLNALKETWNRPSEDKKIDKRYFSGIVGTEFNPQVFQNNFSA